MPALGTTFEEATRPGCLELGDVKLGFAATGIITGQHEEHRAGQDKPGQAAYRRPADFQLVVHRLAALPADYRILSIHYGSRSASCPTSAN
jgi:hypothetical protein